MNLRLFTLFTLTEGRPPGQRPSLSPAASRQKKPGRLDQLAKRSANEYHRPLVPGAAIIAIVNGYCATCLLHHTSFVEKSYPATLRKFFDSHH